MPSSVVCRKDQTDVRCRKHQARCHTALKYILDRSFPCLVGCAVVFQMVGIAACSYGYYQDVKSLRTISAIHSRCNIFVRFCWPGACITCTKLSTQGCLLLVPHAETRLPAYEMLWHTAVCDLWHTQSRPVPYAVMTCAIRSHDCRP